MMSFCFFFLGWAFAGGPPNAPVDLSVASTAFAQGEYEKAAQAYLEELSDGQNNSDVYYNLGNALYRSEEVGRALLAWRISQQLSPRRGDAHANILHVQQGLDGSIEAPSTLGPLFLGGSLSLREQAWAASVLLGLVGVVLLWGRRRKRFPLGIPALLLGLPGVLLAVSAVLTFRAPPGLVVLQSGLELRSAVGLSGGVLLRELEAGSELRFVDQVQDFVLVEVENGENGWLPAGQVGWVDPRVPFPM
jgi:tetratricopeptide (TPR) repeat protein